MADYIVVKNVSGVIMAYIFPGDGVKDCYIDRRLNGEATLEFYLTIASEKWIALTPECRIIADGREFSILKDDAKDVQRDQNGTLWGKAMAEESWALMGKREVTVSNDPQTPTPADLQVIILSGGDAAGGYAQGSAGSALTYLLEDDPEWALGTVDVTGTYDLETEKLSRLENIEKVQELWGGFLVFEYVIDSSYNVTQRIVHLRDETLWQDYTGFEVRYAKNLKHITRTENNDIVTKLYPFGADDLDISSVNGGVKYLVNNTYSPNGYTGFYINEEITDAQELMDEATEELAKICQPRYIYKVGLVDTTTLSEWSHEGYSLGDMVDVIDPDIGTAKVRLQRHKYNVFQPWVCELEIGEPEETLAAKLASSFDVAEYVDKKLKPNTDLANLLKGFVDTFTTAINGASGDYTMVDGVSTWWESVDGVRTGNIVRITPGGLGISSDSGQTYETAITGLGILADKIIITDSINLITGDGYTKMIGSGLVVFDDTLTKRVHIGNFSEDKWGIQINSGYLEIIGTLDEDNIPNISADKIEGGTITATEAIYLGDVEFELNATNKQMRIRDAANNTRVLVGANSGQYGMWVYNSAGTVIFDSQNLSIGIGTGEFAIKTADTGARVVIDNLGIRAYNSDNVNTVNISVTGSVDIMGTFKTAQTGHNRVELTYNYGDINIYTALNEQIFTIYNGLDHVSIYSPAGMPIQIGSTGKDVLFYGDIDFTNATVTGLSTIALFG